jgi:hypothetical protein
MITQHVVSYDGEITVTRLPAGRAEGYVWLSFVARGIELPGTPEEMWRINDHLRLTWLDGSVADIVHEGGTGDQTLHLFDLAIRDAGYNTLCIGYLEGDQVIGHEAVPLPVPSAP